MKMKNMFLFAVVLLCTQLIAQQNNYPWEKFDYLIGTWEGGGSGKPGEGGGNFTFKLDLDKNILVRTSHSEYPASENKPAAIHEDLMVIYPDNTGIPNRAIYFDNEKHVINYTISFPGDSLIVFTSEKIPNVPTFRLTYTQVGAQTTNIKFELAPDGEKFFTYIEGAAEKKK